MRQLSSLEKWSYAIGNMPFSVKDAAFVNFVVFYYTQVQGLSGTLTGLAMFIALSWDAISDPVVGSWSDTIRTRWGRRHPLLVAGGVPTALLFLALFQPPGNLGETGIFLWLLGVSILLRTFLTIYFIPYSAMGAELSTDYDERTVIAKARVSMGWLAGMVLPAIGFAVIFQTRGEVDGRLVQSNYIDYGILSAVLAGVTAVFCVWGTRTVIPRLPQSQSTDAPFTLVQPYRDLKIALGNYKFRLTMGAGLAFGIATGVFTTLSLYLGTYFWELSSDQLAGLVVPTALATMLAFVVLARLGQRYDKPSMLGAACLILAINFFCLVGARLLGLLPANGHPLIYILVLTSTGIGVFAIVMLHVVTISLMADLLDEQELSTGRRQEGVFFAAAAFVLKATTGLGAMLAGVVIDIVGLAPGSEPGSIELSVLQSLGWFAVILTSGMAVIAFAFYRRINMTREDQMLVKQQLAQRAAG
jgi:GPH family glycoside/pentoside/hexuronide:cation symporter